MPKVNPDKLTKVTIDVNAKIVKKGKINDSEECPIALAVRAVVAKNVEVDVLNDEITLMLPGTEDLDEQYHYIETPARAAKFIDKLDAMDPDSYAYDETVPTERPKPFSFVVKIPNKFLKPSLRA